MPSVASGATDRAISTTCWRQPRSGSSVAARASTTTPMEGSALPGGDRGCERREPALKVAAHHLVHIHEQSKDLTDPFVLPGHQPRHLRAARSRAERERRGVQGLERLGELQPDPDAARRYGLHDLHGSAAGLSVAVPLIARAGPCVAAE